MSLGMPDGYRSRSVPVGLQSEDEVRARAGFASAWVTAEVMRVAQTVQVRARVSTGPWGA